jgi:hypothetical protein
MRYSYEERQEMMEGRYEIVTGSRSYIRDYAEFFGLRVCWMKEVEPGYWRALLTAEPSSPPPPENPFDEVCDVAY